MRRPRFRSPDQGLTQSVNLRGIGIASGSPAVANGVAFNIDGIFQPPIVTSSTFTTSVRSKCCVGRRARWSSSNSTGGAVFINTQNPSTDRVKGYTELSYGSYNLRSAEGAVNLPFSDTFAVRLAGVTRWRDSYYDDLGPLPQRARQPRRAGGPHRHPVPAGKFPPARRRSEWVDKNTGGYAYRPIEGHRFRRRPAGTTFRDLTYNAPTLNHERAFNSSIEMRYELDGGIVLALAAAATPTSGSTTCTIPTVRSPIVDTNNGTGRTPSPPRHHDQFVREREWTQEFNVISPDRRGTSTGFVGATTRRTRSM